LRGSSKLHGLSKSHRTSTLHGSSMLHRTSNVLIIAVSMVLLHAYVTVWLFFAIDSSQSSTKETIDAGMSEGRYESCSDFYRIKVRTSIHTTKSALRIDGLHCKSQLKEIIWTWLCSCFSGSSIRASLVVFTPLL
jgi:hypothetical protein